MQSQSSSVHPPDSPVILQWTKQADSAAESFVESYPREHAATSAPPHHRPAVRRKSVRNMAPDLGPQWEGHGGTHQQSARPSGPGRAGDSLAKCHPPLVPHLGHSAGPRSDRAGPPVSRRQATKFATVLGAVGLEPHLVALPLTLEQLQFRLQPQASVFQALDLGHQSGPTAIHTSGIHRLPDPAPAPRTWARD